MVIVCGVTGCDAPVTTHPSDDGLRGFQSAGIDAQPIDYYAALTRTDEVKNCVQMAAEGFALDYEPGFLPNDFTRLSCECQAGTVRWHLRQTGVELASLETATLQLVFNRNALPFDPTDAEDIDAFVQWVKDYGHQQLGFGPEDLPSAFETAASALEASLLHRETVDAAVPACGELSISTHSHFGTSNETQVLDTMSRHAMARAGLDLERIDGVLASNTPRNACEHDIERLSFENIPEASEGSRSTAQCHAFVSGFLHSAAPDTQQHSLAFEQFAVLALYVVSFREDLDLLHLNHVVAAYHASNNAEFRGLMTTLDTAQRKAREKARGT